jgi:hypothetical protein
MRIGIHLGRRRFVLVAAVLGVLAAGGVAYATIPDAGGVFTACRSNANGSLRLIDPSSSSGSLLSRCTGNETQVSWNQKGQAGAAGADGKSPTVAQLQTGDSHCPAGGASLTDASGNVAYVCNGANGADGKSFAGSFTSPNGQFSLSVSDAGVKVVGPDSSITLPAGGGIFIDGGDIQVVAHDETTHVLHDRTESVDGNESTTVGAARTESVGKDESITIGGSRTESVASDESVTVGGSRTESVGKDEQITIHGNRTENVDQNETISVGRDRTESVGATQTTTVGLSWLERAGAGFALSTPGPFNISGVLIGLNNTGAGCKPAARRGDLVNSTQIVTGSSSVCIGD